MGEKEIYQDNGSDNMNVSSVLSLDEDPNKKYLSKVWDKARDRVNAVRTNRFERKIKRLAKEQIKIEDQRRKKMANEAEKAIRRKPLEDYGEQIQEMRDEEKEWKKYRRRELGNVKKVIYVTTALVLADAIAIGVAETDLFRSPAMETWIPYLGILAIGTAVGVGIWSVRKKK